MMKRVFPLLIFCVSFFFLVAATGAVAAVPGKVISEENEFGGKTVEKVYVVKDAKVGKAAKKGKSVKESKIQKDTTYFDGKGKKVKVESLYTEKHTAATGAERRIAYFNAKGELTKMEKYFIEQYAKLKGIDKMVVYYDLKKKQPKTEYYLGAKPVKAPK